MNSERTLLIVDDEELLRKAIGALFSRLGFRILLAANGAEALTVLSREKVNVVISDSRMPVMDGLSFLREARRRDAHLPVIIFMTGFFDVSAEEVFDLGCAAVFSKPFEREELVQAVVRFQQQEIPVVERKEPELFAKELAESAMGHGGFRVCASREYQCGDQIRFQIEFPAAGAYLKLEGLGAVRWVRRDQDPMVGVEILGLTEVSLALFNAWRKVRRPSSYIPRSA